MSAFWDTWRTEIIRGATLFFSVLAIGFFAHYLLGRARQGVVEGIPAAMRDLRSEFDPDAGGGPRATGGTWTYHAKVAPKQWVWIHNRRGSVTVEPAKGDSLQVTAVKTYRSSDTASVRLVTAPYDGGIAVCAVWPGQDAACGPGKSFTSGRSHGNDVAVDFTVRVPAGVGVGAITQVGDVHVTGASAPVVAATVSGDLNAETTHGPVNAVSVNGNVHARMNAFGDTGGVSVVTVNGSVTAELPQSLDADVQATTINGSITTDYPLTASGRFTSHKLQGTVGKGGREVKITTVNGSITLKKAI